MSVDQYAITIENRERYLYASVVGPNTVETIGRYSADVREACLRAGQMLEVYKAIAASSDRAAGLGMRAAYVDLNPEHGAENMHLAEGIAGTRGIPVRTFRDIGTAEAWLLSSL
jgi:hypothetical protein